MSPEERNEAKNIILSHQGFSSHLDQYQLVEEIGGGSCNPVWLAKHHITGQNVAIKAINMKKYTQHTIENHISESEALYRCHRNESIIQFVEEF